MSSSSASNPSNPSTMSPFPPQHNAYSAPGRPNTTPFAPVRPSPLANSGIATDALHTHNELDETSSVANYEESVYERTHLLQQHPSVSSFSSTASHARVLSESAVPPVEYEHAEHGNGQGSGGSNGKQTFTRRNSEGSTHLKNRQPRTLVDNIDQLDITAGLYGAGLFHHESPYDCALPHHSSNADAPVRAFEYTDSPEHVTRERPAPSSNLTTLNALRREGADGIHHPVYEISYRDSFLEGSPAYGAENRMFAARENNRKSFFKRISTVGAKIGVSGTRR